VQLLEVFSSAANFDITEPGLASIEAGEADGVSAAGDLRRDATVVATCFGLCGLATCFGAWTVMLGSEVAKPVAVCDIAVPLGPHNNAVDRMATAEGATKLDDNLMTCPSQIRDGNAVPIVARYHTFRIGPPRIEKISADDSPSTWPPRER